MHWSNCLFPEVDDRKIWLTYKQLQEFQNPLVSEDVKGIACHRVNDGKSMDFVFDERVHSIKQAAKHNHSQTIAGIS